MDVKDTDKGLTVSVYRNADPSYAVCNKAALVTGKFHNVLLLGVPGPTTYQDFKMQNDPAAVMRVVTNERTGHVYALPAGVDGDGTGGWCFSGNFLYATDSRFGRINNYHPIPCHDQRVS